MKFFPSHASHNKFQRDFPADLRNYTAYLKNLQLINFTTVLAIRKPAFFVVKYSSDLSSTLHCNYSNLDAMKSNASTHDFKANSSSKWSKCWIISLISMQSTLTRLFPDLRNNAAQDSLHINFTAVLKPGCRTFLKNPAAYKLYNSISSQNGSIFCFKIQ